MFTRFKELSVGDTFDFVDDTNPANNSFFSRCIKSGSRSYRTIATPVVEGMARTSHTEYKINTIMCKVFHVEYAPIKL